MHNSGSLAVLGFKLPSGSPVAHTKCSILSLSIQGHSYFFKHIFWTEQNFFFNSILQKIFTDIQCKFDTLINTAEPLLVMSNKVGETWPYVTLGLGDISWMQSPFYSKCADGVKDKKFVFGIIWPQQTVAVVHLIALDV